MKKKLSLFYASAKNSELLRFISIGSLCALSDIALLYLFVSHLHIWYLSAATLSFIIVTFFGYFGHKYFTFRNYQKKHKKQISVFFIIAGTGMAINTLCMFLFVSIAGIWYIASSVITKFIVLIWNFLASKTFVFRKESKIHG